MKHLTKTKKIKILCCLLVICVPMILYSCAEKSDSSAAYTITGRVVDGPIKGATIFADLNNNGEKDTDEPQAITDKDGNYTLESAIDIPKDTKLIARGGLDTVTNESLTNNVWISKVPEEIKENLKRYIHVSPMTTMLASLESDTSYTEEKGKKMLKDWGFEDVNVIDMYNIDYYKLSQEGTGAEKERAKKIEKHNQKLATMYKTTHKMMGSNKQHTTANYKDMMEEVSKEMGEKMLDPNLPAEFDLFSSANMKEVMQETYKDHPTYAVSDEEIEWAIKAPVERLKLIAKTEDGQVDETDMEKHLNFTKDLEKLIEACKKAITGDQQKKCEDEINKVIQETFSP
jgi:hypothetical protein